MKKVTMHEAMCLRRYNLWETIWGYIFMHKAITHYPMAVTLYETWCHILRFQNLNLVARYYIKNYVFCVLELH